MKPEASTALPESYVILKNRIKQLEAEIHTLKGYRPLSMQEIQEHNKKVKKNMHSKTKAPWSDFSDKPIFDGNTILHPSGEKGVVFLADDDDPADKWRVRYEDGQVHRLCLQIDDKAMGIVVPQNAEASNIEGVRTSMNEPMKNCSNCTHYNSDHNVCEKALGEIDIVSGRPFVFQQNARNMRYSEAFCGAEGRWFEKKE